MAKQSQPEKTTLNPLHVLAIGVAVILFVFAVSLSLLGGKPTISGTQSQSAAQPVAAGTLAQNNNGVQEVAITMQGNQYMPNPVRVKVGVPVRFTVDLNTVRGCYRAMVIPELDVTGRVATGSNTIEFTPTKTGTFRMTCGMGMASGTIIVEDENGQAPPATAQAAPLRAAGSCGMGGGCGCGG